MKIHLLSMTLVCALLYLEHKCLEKNERLIKSYGETEALFLQSYAEAEKAHDEDKKNTLINLLAESSKKRDRLLLKSGQTINSLFQILGSGIIGVNLVAICVLILERHKKNKSLT